MFKVFKDSPAFSGISTNDSAATLQFYTDILGLDATKHDDTMFNLNLAGGGKVFIYQKPNHLPATFTVLNFPVPDVEAAVDALAARGVVFERYEGMDQDAKGIAHGMGPDIAWFTDPGGNILAVLSDDKM